MPPVKLQRLDTARVISIYQRLLAISPTGKVNMTDLYNQVAETMVSARTGKPFSRARLYSLLKESSLVHLGHNVKALPIICVNSHFPNISQWLLETITPAEHYSYDKLTVDVCDGRDIYGAPPIACMVAARNVWWVFYDRHPINRDITDFTDVYFRRIRCQLAEYLPNSQPLKS